MGFPTANLRVSKEKILPPGVFAVQVTLPDGKRRRGLCNVGVRPTVAQPLPQCRVEVHLLGFSGNLLGKTLGIEFLRRIRSERKFPSLKALSCQIRLDEKAAQGRGNGVKTL